MNQNLRAQTTWSPSRAWLLPMNGILVGVLAAAPMLAKPGDTKLARVLNLPGKPSQLNSFLTLSDGSLLFPGYVIGQGTAGGDCLVHKEKDGAPVPGWPKTYDFKGVAPKNHDICRYARHLPGGNILLVGTARAAVDLSGGDGLLAVIDQNGVLQKSFDKDGFLLFDLNGGTEHFWDATLVRAGAAGTAPGTGANALATNWSDQVVVGNSGMNAKNIVVFATSRNNSGSALVAVTFDSAGVQQGQPVVAPLNLDLNINGFSNHTYGNDRLRGNVGAIAFNLDTSQPKAVVSSWNLSGGVHLNSNFSGGLVDVNHSVFGGPGFAYGRVNFVGGDSSKTPNRAVLGGRSYDGLNLGVKLTEYFGNNTTGTDIVRDFYNDQTYVRSLSVSGLGWGTDRLSATGTQLTWSNNLFSPVLWDPNDHAFGGEPLYIGAGWQAMNGYSGGWALSPGDKAPGDRLVVGERAAVTFTASDLVLAGWVSVGNIKRAAYAVIEGPAPNKSKCVPTAKKLCLSDGRFEVAAYQTSGGPAVQANAVALTPDTGYFWFFEQNNVEVVVKVLNACPSFLNNRFWVFAAGLTNVGVVLRVRDTQTGEVRESINPNGRAFPPDLDTNAFNTCASLPPEAVKIAEFTDEFTDEYTEHADAVANASVPSRHNERWTRLSQPVADSILLNKNRFKVEATFKPPNGAQGTAHAIKLTNDTAYFWFFDDKNVEVVFKLIDACGAFLNNRFWFFAAGLTNVRVDITVTDTKTSQVKTYINALNTPFVPIQDTNAFNTCP